MTVVNNCHQETGLARSLVIGPGMNSTSESSSVTVDNFIFGAMAKLQFHPRLLMFCALMVAVFFACQKTNIVMESKLPVGKSMQLVALPEGKHLSPGAPTVIGIRAGLVSSPINLVKSTQSAISLGLSPDQWGQPPINLGHFKPTSKGAGFHSLIKMGHFKPQAK